VDHSRKLKGGCDLERSVQAMSCEKLHIWCCPLPNFTNTRMICTCTSEVGHTCPHASGESIAKLMPAQFKGIPKPEVLKVSRSTGATDCVMLPECMVIGSRDAVLLRAPCRVGDDGPLWLGAAAAL